MPTFVHGKNAKVLIGEHDLSSSFKEFTASTNIDMAETSAFGNTNKTYVQGLGDASISINGMFSGGTDEVDDVLGATLAATGTLPVTIAPSGYGIGKRAFGLGAQTASYEITGSIGDVVAVGAQFQAAENSGGKSGVLLTASASLSASGNQASQDQAAATTNGAYALLHVTANTRDADVTVTIEDSADNSAWATIGTFTVVSAADLTSEYLAIAGTVRRYVRAVVTLAAGTGSVTPTVLFVRL